MIARALKGWEGVNLGMMNKYQQNWESRSSVRTRPRKIIDFKQQGYFFPASKQTLLLLPEVVALGQEVKKQILLHSFYKYLNDIISLEIKLINSACNRIIYEDLLVGYPEEIKFNAYTIIIDEYYHVYIANDMLQQLAQFFPNFSRLPFPVSDAYHAVTTIQERLAPEYRGLFEIMAVCIFETTLVRELVEFFNDTEVHVSIRYYVNDHMNDEAKHYGYDLSPKN